MSRHRTAILAAAGLVAIAAASWGAGRTAAVWSQAANTEDVTITTGQLNVPLVAASDITLARYDVQGRRVAKAAIPASPTDYPLQPGDVVTYTFAPTLVIEGTDLTAELRCTATSPFPGGNTYTTEVPGVSMLTTAIAVNGTPAPKPEDTAAETATALVQKGDRATVDVAFTYPHDPAFERDVLKIPDELLKPPEFRSAEESTPEADHTPEDIRPGPTRKGRDDTQRKPPLTSIAPKIDLRCSLRQAV